MTPAQLAAAPGWLRVWSVTKGRGTNRSGDLVTDKSIDECLTLLVLLPLLAVLLQGVRAAAAKEKRQRLGKGGELSDEDQQTPAQDDDASEDEELVSEQQVTVIICQGLWRAPLCWNG